MSRVDSDETERLQNQNIQQFIFIRACLMPMLMGFIRKYVTNKSSNILRFLIVVTLSTDYFLLLSVNFPLTLTSKAVDDLSDLSVTVLSI